MSYECFQINNNYEIGGFLSFRLQINGYKPYDDRYLFMFGFEYFKDSWIDNIHIFFCKIDVINL